eukprot:6190083-Pleurochrysis_carterae.AAC.1
MPLQPSSDTSGQEAKAPRRIWRIAQRMQAPAFHQHHARGAEKSMRSSIRSARKLWKRRWKERVRMRESALSMHSKTTANGRLSARPRRAAALRLR